MLSVSTAWQLVHDGRRRSGVVLTAEGRIPVSPRWATVGTAALYFYPSEPHQRPHVDVLGRDWNVKIALDTFEILVSSGKVPPKLLKGVIELLRDHQDEAIAAYHATMAHRFPGTLRHEEDES